jgi:hypothetical protein
MPAGEDMTGSALSPGEQLNPSFYDGVTMVFIYPNGWPENIFIIRPVHSCQLINGKSKPISTGIFTNA